MSLETITIVVLLVGLLVFLAMGLEIAWAVGIMAGVGLVLFVNQPLNEFAWSSWNTLNSFVLTACPLFIFMGTLLANTGVSEYLFRAVEKWAGNLPGGLANAVIVGNAIFGAMCGSSIAATATFGKVAFPSLEKRGYDPKLALGSIAVGAVLSPLIPPSILLIIYGAWQSVSIIDLFAAAIIPGIMLTTLLIITIIIRVKLNPKLVPRPPEVTWKERLSAIKEILPFVAIIMVVLGVIFGGVMTPSEAGAMGAFLSIVASLAYKRLNLKILRESLLETVKITSMAFFIMAMATVLSHVLNSAGITVAVKSYMVGLPIGRYGIIGLLLVLYFIMGMFFNSWAMLFITFPLVMPVIVAFGINPIWWGVVYVLAAEQSMVTPPFGYGLFVLSSVVPQHPVETVVRGSLPFLIPLYVTIFILIAFPDIVLWLPSVLG